MQVRQGVVPGEGTVSQALIRTLEAPGDSKRRWHLYYGKIQAMSGVPLASMWRLHGVGESTALNLFLTTDI